MSFLPAEIIRKKRFGGAHSREELHFLIQEYANDRIPDYQMSAWLMAVCFKGMTREEAAILTLEMRDSGVVLDLSALGVSVDKHSTGGVGDKTSLILAPLVAAAGVPVPMMAGRGLAHTGGTLDKLESISGFNVNLSFEQFKQQITRIGAAIIGQTKEICPADRKLYALRDVTGTVDSLPLICGSIMSKKLAEGMSALVLDVKFGSGAFMKTVAQAEELAGALKNIGEHCEKKVVALLTRMDEPLGRYIGNALEVRECLDIMSGRNPDDPGKGYDDTVELSLTLASHMIFLGGKSKSLSEARQSAERLLSDGSALAKFKEICRTQGGDLSQDLPLAPHSHFVTAAKEGYFAYENIEMLGVAGLHLGAGRKFQTDTLDPAAGIEILVEPGDRVKPGSNLFKLHFTQEERLPAALSSLSSAFSILDKKPSRSPLIAKVIT